MRLTLARWRTTGRVWVKARGRRRSQTAKCSSLVRACGCTPIPASVRRLDVPVCGAVTSATPTQITASPHRPLPPVTHLSIPSRATSTPTVKTVAAPLNADQAGPAAPLVRHTGLRPWRTDWPSCLRATCSIPPSQTTVCTPSAQAGVGRRPARRSGPAHLARSRSVGPLSEVGGCTSSREA